MMSGGMMDMSTVDRLADEYIEYLRRRMDEQGVLLTMLEESAAPASLDYAEADATISMTVWAAGTRIEIDGPTLKVLSAWTRK